MMQNDLSPQLATLLGYRWYITLFFAVLITFLVNFDIHISYFILILLICSFLLDFKKATYLYLFLLLVSADTEIIVFLAEKFELGQIAVSHSIILDSLFGMTLMKMITIFLFFISIVFMISAPQGFIRIHPAILLGIFVPLAIPMYGFLVNPFNIAMADSAQFICFFAGFFMCYFSQLEIKKTVEIIFFAVMASLIVNLIFSAGHGVKFIQFGSIGNLFPIVLLYSELCNHTQKIGYYFLAGLNILIFPGRSRLLGYFYVIACRFCLKGEVRQKMHFFFALLSVLAGLSLLMMFLPEKFESYFFWKMSTFLGSGDQALSSHVRVLELQNILMLNLDHLQNFLIGGGYGSCFEDYYAAFPASFLNFQGTNYSEVEILQHCFSRPHTNLAVILLKSGLLLGCLFFASNFLLVFSKLRKVINDNLAMKIYRILYFIPFWVVVGYNQKSFVLYGVFIYFLNQALTHKQGD